jgi:hypothetical protein
MKHGQIVSEQRCPVGSFKRKNGVRGKIAALAGKVVQQVRIAGLTRDMIRCWSQAERQRVQVSARRATNIT